MDIIAVRENVEAVAKEWSSQMDARLARRTLDPADFATLRHAGLTLTGVPVAIGGVWHGARRSTRLTGAMFRSLARVDPSVALVVTMHPIVLALWLEEPVEPPIYPDAWQEQRDRVLSAAEAGHWFGTINSEPGGGGDLTTTRATATHQGEGVWRVTGDKHMGSGSGVTSFMITAAVPAGEKTPDIFLIDTRDLPWDGSRGVTTHPSAAA
jgi:alkylation response protein AidB-like acyl-CoA dehydrogenase